MDVEKLFAGSGGKFLKSPGSLTDDLKSVEAFIFDWDGVFNNGSKLGNQGSSYSEVDSMGINLLRFSWWLKTRRPAPVFIITGENNPPALELSQREFYNAVFLSFKDKKQALNIISEKYHVRKENIAMVFDDVLDLSIAKICRISFGIGRKSTPMLTKFITDNNICSYITGSEGGHYAVREVCELIMALEGSYETVLQHRIEFSNEYRTYLEERKLILPDVVNGKEIG